DNVTLRQNSTGTVTFNGSATLADSGGARTVSKDGAGTVALAIANSYTGGTSVNAGPILAGNNGAFGSNTVTITGTAGTQVQLASGVNVGNALIIQGGSGVSGQGALYVPTASASA